MTVEIVTERVRVEVSDYGTTMDAYVARPASGGPHPGMLVLQEIFGVDAHIRDVAERLAREGYAALAPDLFHRTTPGYEGTYDDIPANIQVAMQYKPDQAVADLRAALDHLASLPGVQRDRLGSMGFCLGGTLSFAANAIAPLRAAVSFYGGGIAPDRLPMVEKQSGPILFFWAGKDEYISLESQRAVADAMRKHDKPFVNVEVSGVDHGFFCDGRANYDAAAATQAWALTLAFLRSHI